MATITAAAGGGNWTAGATWTGGVAPTAADDAVLNATSGNVTINSGAVCRSLDCTGYTGTLTHSASVTFGIGDATAGTGNVAFRLVAGMTYTVGSSSTSVIKLQSTSTTQQTITTGGKVVGTMQIYGTGSSYILSDTFAGSTTATIEMWRGTFNTNNYNVTCRSFAFYFSGVRTCTLGSSTITCSEIWFINTNPASNITLNAGTSTIIQSGNQFGGGGLTYNNVTINNSTNGSVSVIGTNTFSSFTFTGSSSKIDELRFENNQTVTGTLTINGNSSTNRVLVSSGFLGTPRTITAATWSVSNVDFQDITGAGAGSRNLSAITGLSGDCGGNSGFTFTTAATQTANGTTSFSWSNPARWTSRVPLPQDDVIINNAFGTSQTITGDMPRLGRDIDFTGTTWTTSLTWNIGSAYSKNTLFGGLRMVSGMSTSGSATTLVFEGRIASTLATSASNTLAFGLRVDCVSGSITLGSDVVTNIRTITIASGTFSAVNGANNYVITTGWFELQGGTVTLGSATHLLTASSSNPWSKSGGTLTAYTGIIKFTNTGATAVNFVGGGATYANVWFARGASTANITITGSNTFGDLKDSGTAAHSLRFTAGTTQTIGTFTVSGTAGNLITLDSTTTASFALVKSGSGVVSSDYLNIQHSVATPASTWYAGANSVNNQSVVTAGSGWTFTVPPPPPVPVVGNASFLYLMT